MQRAWSGWLRTYKKREGRFRSCRGDVAPLGTRLLSPQTEAHTTQMSRPAGAVGQRLMTSRSDLCALTCRRGRSNNTALCLTSNRINTYVSKYDWQHEVGGTSASAAIFISTPPHSAHLATAANKTMGAVDRGVEAQVHGLLAAAATPPTHPPTLKLQVAPPGPQRLVSAATVFCQSWVCPAWDSRTAHAPSAF